ncbi:MAG: ABC transporter ATP-binding protein [Candidatus Marinimicrobia bacterium]|nr:ABC transporter ATP-binding protein [Candidatus Neomarinimicrobiota bacterium]
MPLLEIRGLETFYGKIKVLHGITIAVTEGQIATVLGSNGAGKTTLLRTISGIVEAEYGQIIFRGQRIERLDTDRIVQAGIAHVPQGRLIFSELTVEENLKLGAYTQRSHDGMETVFSYFPLLKDRLAQYAGTLSGGEQQMLAISRALMSKPKLILLDEPSLGLSPKLVQEIFHILKRLNEDGLTILLVEQNVNLALDICDYAYVLKNGRIFLSGNPEKVRQEELVRESYLGEGKGKYIKRAKIWGRQ